MPLMRDPLEENIKNVDTVVRLLCIDNHFIVPFTIQGETARFYKILRGSYFLCSRCFHNEIQQLCMLALLALRSVLQGRNP